MAKSGSEKAWEYIQSRESESQVLVKGPSITVSRESGAGSGIVDEILKTFLEKHQITNTSKWGIFDRNLIEKVLEDHNLPDRLARLMSHENQSAITSMMNELLGLSPSMRTLFHKTSETIMQLAQMGNVIIVGRAGNLVTSRLNNCFHVRLVAPLENRVKRIQEYYQLDKKEAAEWVKKEDQSRREYYLKHFHKNIDDPLLYHLVVNTGEMTYSETAHLIGRSVMEKFPQTFTIESQSAFISVK